MLVIGLTGGIGSGKTTVANCFAELGAPIIDADIIARQIVKPNSKALSKIVEHFGNEFIASNGELDRAKLSQKIFHSECDRIWLEDLLHPLIWHTITQQVSALNAPYCLVVVPLLLETKSNPLIQRILVVDCPEKLQKNRVSARDTRSTSEIDAILQRQLPREKRLMKADDVLDNSDNFEVMRKRVIELHKYYTSYQKP